MPNFEHSYALIIGINDYGNGISSLTTAVSDATEIAHLLETEHDYTVNLLLNQAANLSQLRQVLEIELPKKIQAGDRFLFYFAGHGIALNGEDGPEGYLVPQNAKLGNVSTYLRMSDVNQALLQLPCRHFLGILDCCFAGAFRWSSLRKAIAVELGILHKERYDRFIQDPAWQVLTSAASDQSAWDAFDLKDDRGQIGVHSPFASALIEAFEGKADAFPPAEPGKPAGDGVITASELYLYLRDRVEIATETRAIRQTPGIYPLKKHDKGEYIFLTPGHALNLLPAPPLDESKNPYRGLSPFEEQHSNLFFGRNALTQKLYEFVTSHSLTIVLGASGSGKSSLVKAGLIPKLRQCQDENSWFILPPFRPGKSPFKALNHTLGALNLPAIDTPNQATSSDSLTPAQSLANWFKKHPQANLLLIVDQFEELITLCHKDQERQQFLEALAGAISTHPNQLHLVITLRSDFDTQFRNTTLHKEWQTARFVVPAMTRGELREAIENPAEARVMYFQPHDLVEQLINEVADMPGALPLLSFALSELYLKYLKRQRDAENGGIAIDRALTQADYQDLGGVIQSLTQRADEEYQALVQENPAYSHVIRDVMMRMVAIDGSELARRRVPLSELEYPPDKNSLIKQVIEHFSQARLLVKGQDAEGNPYVEPAHDALVRGWERLLTWKQQQQESLILQRRLTPAALEWNSQQSPTFHWTPDPHDWLEQLRKRKQQTKFLWHSNPRLNFLEQVLDSIDNWFNQVEAEFVRLSLQRQRDKRHQTIGLVAIAFAAVLAFAGYQWYLSQVDRIKTLTASSQALFASDQKLDALIDGLKVGKQLKRAIGVDSDTKFKALTALQQAVYWVRERNRLGGHRSEVGSIAWSPDGKLLASGSADGTIKLWNQDGKDFQTLKHGAPILSVAWSPDGKMLVSGSFDGTIKLWNKDGKEFPTLKHSSKVYSVAWSPDGKMLVSGSFDGTIKLWNQDGKELQTLKHSSKVYSVAWSPDGKMLASGSSDGTIELWNQDGKELNTLKHSGQVVGIRFSPDGKLLASISRDGIIKLWNKDGKEFKTLKHRGQIVSMNFSPDGKLLALVSGNDEKTIELWSTVDGKEIWNQKPHSDSVRSVVWSPDGKMLASASIDKTVKLWSLEGKQVKALRTIKNRSWVESAAWSSDGKMLAWGSNDGIIKLWALEGKELKTLIGHGDVVRSVNFSPDGKKLASGSDDSTIKLWNLEGQELPGIKGRHSSKVYSVAWSFDGKRLASGSEDNTVKLWSKDGKELWSHKENQDVRSVSFSPDGQLLAWTSGATIKLSSKDGKEIKTLKGHKHAIFSVSFSHDSKMLASGSSDGTIKLWNFEGKELKTLRGHQSRVRSVAWSPDDKLLVSGSEDKTIKLWSLENGKEIWTFDGDDGWVYSVSFSPDGKFLASGSDSSTIKLWNLEDKELKMRLTGDGDVVRSIDWSPDSKWLASGGNGKTVLLWNLELLELDRVISHGCEWARGYLENNPNVDKSDRHLCDDVPK